MSLNPEKHGLQRKNQFTYFCDELGHILETRPVGGMGGAEWDQVLTPLRKPVRPLEIDTPAKLKAWDDYWAHMVSWWESERLQERRARW